MISPKPLLTDLQKWVTKFENDLRQRCREVPELDASLKADWQKARDIKRTAEAYEVWRDGQLTQSAVGWVLGCVFVRFLEDNQLLDRPWIAGAGDRRTEAEHVRDAFFTQNPTLSDRDYLQHVFTEVGRLPGMADLFDRRHNALWRAGISGDAAAEFIAFWRKMDHDFTDAEWGTRFLGDLYQDLSEHAKKTFALLQTPEFIEEFILDRTLDPAIERFGYEQVRMIDPTCGSGHFVLGGFQRLLKHWQKSHPEMNEREIAKNALAGVAGVDINPFAVAIARFRLLLAAWKFCAITRLKAAPDFHVNLAVGDSLLHGRRFGELESNVGAQRTFDTEEIFRDELKHHYEVEDIEDLHRILGQPYHAVVGNPPYITVKDRALSELYRARFPSCRGKYSLSVPFMERFFDLAVKGDGTPQQPAGFTGQITANSFMKREFGKKLIEEYLPRWDLTHLLDTSVAYIPGHGTPTVILFGKNQPPVGGTIRTVLGIRGEESTPDDAALGPAWLAITAQIDEPGSVSRWVSATDSPRANFKNHPWSIGGGGAAELKEEIEDASDSPLESFVASIGIGAVTGEDDAFATPKDVFRRAGIPNSWLLDFAEGDIVRDWVVNEPATAIFPYERKSLKPLEHAAVKAVLWPQRIGLRNRTWFRKTQDQRGYFWWEYAFLSAEKYSTPTSIAWGEVATHNHFVLDRCGRVFKQTAPVIKPKHDATEAEEARLVGVLNSSTACFWMQQVCHNKGGPGGGSSKDEKWHDFYALNATKIAKLPFPPQQPTQLPTLLVQTSRAQQGQTPAATLASWGGPGSGDLRACLARARDDWHRQRHQLIAWQEELDWQIYEAFGLVEPDDGVSVPEGEAMDLVYDFGLELGQRAFEIVLARKMAAGEVQTTWFARHGSTPITELPSHWPSRYRELVEKRIRRIETDANIRLIEQPEYKRRWNTESWDEQLKKALKQWLLARLETAFFEGERIAENGQNQVPASLRNTFAPGRDPRLCTTRQLADVVSHDPAFMQAASVYREREDFDFPKLVQELVEEESVPFLPIQRYKDSGLRKRVIWERTWDLQREEDQIDELIRSLNQQIQARIASKVGQDHPEQVAEFEAKKLALDQADRAYHAQFFPGQDYKPEKPHHEKSLADQPKAGIAAFLTLSGVRSEYLTLKSTMDRLRTQVRFSDEVVVALQEKLDQVPAKPEIAVPPKYTSADFKKPHWWKLRGKLDVPKERWITYSGTDTPSVIAWAGWNHKQQAQALAGYYQERKDQDGWSKERLAPLLAGLKDLLPWLKQWHNDLDPVFQLRLGDFYETFVQDQIHELGMNEAQIEDLRIGNPA